MIFWSDGLNFANVQQAIGDSRKRSEEVEHDVKMFIESGGKIEKHDIVVGAPVKSVCYSASSAKKGSGKNARLASMKKRAKVMLKKGANVSDIASTMGISADSCKKLLGID